MLLILACISASLKEVSGITFPERGEEETGACLRGGEPLLPCMVTGAVSWTEAAKGRDIALDQGLLLLQDRDQQGDEPLSGDPRDAGTLLEAMDRAMSSRRLLWDLRWIYPGLAMVVSRAPDPRLYFTIDRRQAQHDLRESTGRLIVKRAVLPILLGVNLKLASLVPLLIGLLIVLTKKALLISKLSLLISGLGWFRGQETDPDSGSGPVYGTSFPARPYKETFQEDWISRNQYDNSTISFF